MKNFLVLLFLLAGISGFVDASEVTRIIVKKDDRELQLWSGKELLKTYSIKLSISYNDPLFRPGPKRREGDNQTPVGFYNIEMKRDNKSHPWSKFEKSLLISYPNWKDKHNAKVLGIPEDQIGGMILIHGNPKKVDPTVLKFAAKLGIEKETVEEWAKNYFYPYFDWTNGCIAVSDAEMDEIFELVEQGTKINIYP